jgi:hypothetical protein
MRFTVQLRHAPAVSSQDCSTGYPLCGWGSPVSTTGKAWASGPRNRLLSSVHNEFRANPEPAYLGDAIRDDVTFPGRYRRPPLPT